MVERVEQSAEYRELFNRAQDIFLKMNLDQEYELRPRVKSLNWGNFDGAYLSFFKNISNQAFGINFERQGRINGDTTYTFKQDGTVILTGWMSEPSDEYPTVVYKEVPDKNSIVRELPAHNVDIDELRDLVGFIEHPIINRKNISFLKKLPNEKD